MSEPTYRLYHCQRCGRQVRICRRCDRGHIYCAGECSRIRRRESLRRAGTRYQRTHRGARCHASRQQAWRARQMEKVTHQGCQSDGLCESVLKSSSPAAELSDVLSIPTPISTDLHPRWRCAFCASRLPAWARVPPWSWSG